MARDSMQSLLRLRRIELDDAKRTLAQCLTRERTAETTLAAAEAAITRETDAARTSSGDAEVEVFACWLPVGQRDLREAEDERGAAAGETSLARTAVTLARGLVEATENVLERRTAAQRLVAERRAQAMLDEIGLRIVSSDEAP